VSPYVIKKKKVMFGVDLKCFTFNWLFIQLYNSGIQATYQRGQTSMWFPVMLILGPLLL